MELPKNYDSKLYESDLYDKWLKSGVFSADVESNKDPFTVILPPPNATGTLHLGHAVMIALEDIMTRFKRMQGYEALWLPGTDHAGIATQSRVEKDLQNKGMENPREELGREGLIDEIKRFVDSSQSTIRKQMQSIGASCDWGKEAYTFDDSIHESINEIFKRMFDDGLIYQGNRVVNWDPLMHTTVADDEVEHDNQKGYLYYIQYGPLVVATSRPETKLGDTAVAVHPNDERWNEYIGKEIEVEFAKGHRITVPVIADENVDLEFGSGALGVTPAHSLADFEIAEKNNLDMPQVIDFKGNMTKVAGPYAGLNLFECRKQLIEDLGSEGKIIKIEEYDQSVAKNYRGKGIIEPQIMKQWFVDVNKPVIDWKGSKMSIKEVMIDTVKSQMIEIIPERFNKTYFHWIENLRDWCISRQIWWGHQIPIWYKVSNEDMSKIESKNGLASSYELQSLNVEIEDIACVSKKPDGNWVQDPDCLDTWFSSGAWTFTAMGWPNNKDMIEKFHPTDVLETGYDILFFWVARMILMTTYIMRTEGLPEERSIPFKKVYLHGLILDKHGKKMSKSHPDTCIDPLDMIPKYGADALRLSLVIGATPGNNMRLHEEKIAGYRNFINKVWNIGRFIIQSTDSSKSIIDIEKLSLSDKWILSRMQQVIQDATFGLENYRFSEVGESVYAFLKEDFASWYLEIAKIEGDKDSILRYVLSETLKLLHPYIPYITEVLWKEGEFESSMLAENTWPEINDSFLYSEADDFDKIQDLVSKVRRERAEFEVDLKKTVEIYIDSELSIFENNKSLIQKLTQSSYITDKIGSMMPIPCRGSVVWMNVGEIDIEKEKERLYKELSRVEGQLKGIKAKLGNENFLANADPELVAREREKENNFNNRLDTINQRLELL